MSCYSSSELVKSQSLTIKHVADNTSPLSGNNGHQTGLYLNS